MEIESTKDKPVPHSEVCMQGKFIQTRNRGPDAKAALEMVHIDLAGPRPNVQRPS